MRLKLATGLAAVAAIFIAAAPAQAQRWHRGGEGVAAGIAGFAAGAVIGGALASQPRPYGYGYGDGAYGEPGYYEPAYGAPAGYGGPAYGAAPGGGDDEAYCQSRYRSYDPASGTFLGYDGQRHPCP
jgi:BA14K-like protein